jgi:ketosteroid isomerase-like protein
MRIRLLLVASMLLAASGCNSTPADSGETVQAVRAVLEAQQAAWNRGDIDAFMDGYERADTTIFISGDELTRGWQTVLDRYKGRYSSPAQMGTLAFSDLDIRPLDASHVIADGRWRLTIATGTPHGRFTLLLRNTAGGWGIFHDTTTSAP